MIEVADVRKSFRSGDQVVEALRGVSCRIPKGRCAFIVGPSGSGKSTLLYLMGALDRATSGTIRVEGQELGSMSEAEQNTYRRDRIGFIFQSFNLISNLTATGNVLVPFLPRGVTAEQKARAAELLGQVGLGGRRDHRPYQLSGGEQQRVAIARALVMGPGLVLADEPTGNLDPETAEGVFHLLLELHRQIGSTLIVVTHSHEIATRFPRRLTLRAGRFEETQA